MASQHNYEVESADAAEQRLSHVNKVANRLLEHSAIYGLLFRDAQHVHVEGGSVTTHLTLSALHVNSRGGLHGAVSAAIIDFTTGLAIASWDLREKTGASVDMHISYLSSVAGVGDELEITTKAEKVGGSMAFVTVRIEKVEEEGKRTVITLGQHTKYVRQPGGSKPKPEENGKTVKDS